MPPSTVVLPTPPVWRDDLPPVLGRLRKTASWWVYTLRLAFRLARAIRRYRIDLVHTNNTIQSNAPGVLAAMLARRPCVQHLRGQMRPRWETRWLFAHVNHYVAISDVVRRYYADRGLLDGRATTIVYNGLDVAAVADRAEQVAHGKTGPPTVAMFSRMIEFKGLEYFIRAAADVLRQRPDVRFHIHGPIPEPGSPDRPYYDKMSGLVEGLGLGGHLVFAGPYEDVAEVMGNADVAVACSPFDNFGRILFEAMACGLPLVAFDSGGIREVGVHEENLLLVPNRDPSALAAGMLRLLSEPALRERLVQEGRRTARELFDYRSNAGQVLGIYRDLLARGKALNTRRDYDELIIEHKGPRPRQ
jgi:glycosyltransferase involved in cell wall biosynthesis